MRQGWIKYSAPGLAREGSSLLKRIGWLLNERMIWSEEEFGLNVYILPGLSTEQSSLESCSQMKYLCSVFNA